MSSEQTENRKGKIQIPEDWSPTSTEGKGKFIVPKNEELEAAFQKAIGKEAADSISPSRNVSDNENGIATNGTIQRAEKDDTRDSLQTKEIEFSDSKELPVSTVVPKRTTTKQRKESLQEYRQTFLTIPKLEDRKPVFISREVRDRIDEIVHRLGGRGRSVSGFIENLARHHLEIYQDDVDGWKKL